MMPDDAIWTQEKWDEILGWPTKPAKEIKKLYLMHYDWVEAIFDENDKCIGSWSVEDAEWRGEYFNPFMKELGYEILRTPDDKRKLFEKIIKEKWGFDEQD